MKRYLKHNLWELVRFAGVGLFAVATDFVVYFALLFVLPVIPTVTAKTISYICGNIVSFVGHRTFVFRATNKRAIYQVGPFALLYGGTLVLNNIINELALSVTGVYLLSWLLATTAAVSANYLGLKFAVFRTGA